MDKRDITLAPYGAIIGGKAWAGDTSTTDYRISPIYEKLDNLPDTRMFLSTDEIVYPIYEIPERANVLTKLSSS